MPTDAPPYRFRARLWLYSGKAAWHFITLPHDVTDEIDEIAAPTRRGFGSVRVAVTIGSTSWHTSVFPDTKAGSFVLPIKKPVRVAEGLTDGDLVDLTLRLVE
jgi:hypothetical protein